MTTFKGINSIGDTTLTDVLAPNLISLFDWGFVDIGSYFNVTIPTSGQYGGDFHVLRPITDPRYTDGTVWESKRKNWVWEVNPSKGNPIEISGVFVDGSLQTSGYYIDYNNGRVVFDSSKSTSSEVQLEYSYKYVQMCSADYLPFFRRVEKDSFRVDDSNFVVGSGNNIELANNRLQLPAVAVEIVDDREYQGYQLGDSTQWAISDVIFHVMAENEPTARRISDIISYQTDKTVFVFNPKKIANNNDFALDYRGSLVNPSSTYPNLVKPTGDGGYRWTDGIQAGKLRMTNATVQKGDWITRELYHKPVRMTTESVLFI